jgi:hypothetical protein
MESQIKVHNVLLSIQFGMLKLEKGKFGQAAKDTIKK